MEKKLDKIQEDIVEIKETLARNTMSLEIHMQRTELAEARIEKLQEEDLTIKTKIEAHINKVQGAFWAISGIGALILALWQMGIIGKLI